jgi:prolyl oligopeptidase family protein
MSSSAPTVSATPSVDPDRDDELLEHRSGQLLLQGRTAFGKEVYDLMVSTDVLLSLPEVDAGRIGAIGHSAGGNVLVYLMFVDPRIHAGVSSCGYFDLIRFYDDQARKKRLGIFALPNLANVGTAADFLAGVAPRPILLTRGLWEWGQGPEETPFSRTHVQETKDLESYARKRYERLHASDKLRVLYFDEGGGQHAFPPHVREEAYAWLDQQLKHSPDTR